MANTTQASPSRFKPVTGQDSLAPLTHLPIGIERQVIEPTEAEKQRLASSFTAGFIDGMAQKKLCAIGQFPQRLERALRQISGDSELVVAHENRPMQEAASLFDYFIAAQPDGLDATSDVGFRWNCVGYGAGFASAWHDCLILCRVYKGHSLDPAHWRVSGRVAERWPEAERLKAQYQTQLQRGPFKEAIASRRADVLHFSSSLVGRSPAFENALSLLQAAAPTKVTVLLTGETGVGKERFARELHRLSDRKNKPFQAVNCAALPAELVESELFGVERGAYTGANAMRAGRIERCEGGTLLLDEVGDLPLSAQAKLLRVLQFGEIERLGSTQTRVVDVRIVAATNVDLEEAVQKGRFRADLLYRLDVYRIHIPALRNREDDVELLAREILRRVATTHDKDIADFAPQTLKSMLLHAWPGNIRELENRIERAVILTANGCEISPDVLLQSSVPKTSPRLSEKEGDAQPDLLLNDIVKQGFSLPSLEQHLLKESMKLCKGNLAAAARKLGITRPQLSYRLSKLL